MNSEYSRSQRILILALLLSLVMTSFIPGSTTDAKALTGFVKTSPSNGATGQALSVKLDWDKAPSNPYNKDTYYKYCYYTGSGNCDYQGVIYTTDHTISGLAKGTKYYWQIQVIYCKDNSCTGKEKHEANNGTVWSFTTTSSVVDPPGSFAKTSPANNAINVASKVLSWGSSSGATSYHYCYSPNYGDSDCAYLGGWRNVGNVTSYTIPNDSKFIWGNRYYWQIRASNSGGTKLANDGTWWSFTTADLVGTATLFEPTGVINDSTPTYRWNGTTNATWYYLWVNDSKGNNVHKQWYAETTVCTGLACEVTPSVLLGAGNFTWWIQTWNSDGYGPWSNSMVFNTPVPVAPGAATLVAPNGSIGTDYKPTYSWNEVGDATHYYLWVDGPSGNVIKTWYTAAQVNCVSGGNCSIKPEITLSGGAHTWKVQTYNSVGYGPWSATMSFNTVPPPGATTLGDPSGSITDTTPTYTWNEAANATYYYLWVDGPSGNVIKTWYTPAQASCGGGTCSVTPTTTLSGGAYTWKVQTYSAAGYGPWSAVKNFSVNLLTPPGIATLSAPSGNISTNTPDFTWSEVSGATYYYLWVDGPSGNVTKTWYTPAQANCSGGTCSVTLSALGSGAHKWWIQTYNDAGYGPWSAVMNFVVP